MLGAGHRQHRGARDAEHERREHRTQDRPDEAPAAEEKTEGSEPSADDNAPPPVEGKPGGCGCKVAGAPQSSAASAVLLLGLGAWFARRRRAA